MSSTFTRALLSLFFVFSLPGCEQDDDGGGAEAPEDGADEDDLPPAGEVPSALVGDWRSGTVSLTTFWEGNHFVGGSGTAAILRFHEDGTFEEMVYVQQQNYGCRTQVWSTMDGVADFGEGVFRTRLRAGKYKAEDTCVERFNFERPMTPDEVKKGERASLWELGPDGKLLVHADAADADGSTFERVDE
jgi:hypothetical protein